MADGSVIIDTKLDDNGVKKGISNLNSGFSKIGSIAGSALKGVAVATGIATTAITGLVTASVNAYAEYEQLVGGVDTLFKNSSEKLQKYANEAYKTAGLSANEYMSTVTSFSASLLQSLGGDTEKAAEQANSAIIDMSDNANKMGTSMEMIQNAYQGFAKQNYTMLDNLKLGYGGTKEEMQRLLKDAQKLSGVKYNINNLNDVYSAIHIIQTELGITGTTAKEASTTIQGSINSLKGAWNNLLVGITNPDADWDMLIMGLVESISNTGKNLLPAVKSALFGVNALIRDLFPIIVQEIPKLISEMLPLLVETGIKVVNSLIIGIQENMSMIVQTAIQIVSILLQTFMDILPKLLEIGVQVILQLIIGISQMLPTLIPQIVDCVILIVETLIDNIDLLIEAGIELIMGLADGLIEALPRLIEKAPVIVQKLYDAVVRNFPKIVKAGGELIGKLIAGLSGSIFKLLEVAPQLISTIVNGISRGWAEVKNVGKYLVEGLWNGISGMGKWVADKVKSFASNILGNMKKALGIHSPSRVFRDEVGKYIALGVGEGFTDNISSVYKDMKTAVDFQTQKMSANLSTTASFNKMLTATINVNGDVNMDSTKVGRMVAPAVTKTFITGGAY